MSIIDRDIVTVAQLRAILRGKRNDVSLSEVGLQVTRIDPSGICRYCQKKIGKAYDCCTRCADEHGP